METSSQKTTPKFVRWRYILIVLAALILAILLYAALNVTDAIDGDETAAETIDEPSSESSIGIQPASFQQVSEVRDGPSPRLRISGKAEPNAIVMISNRGERRRQVRVNDLGQWGVTLDVDDQPMVLEALLYKGEGETPIRSEETVFRIPAPKPEIDAGDEAEMETEPEAEQSVTPIAEENESALLMVTAPGSPSRIVQSPFGGAPTSGPLSLSVIDYDYQGGVIITGTSAVPGRVRFSAENAVIGETGIGVGGRWNFIAGRLLPRARVINIRAELIPAQGTPNAPVEPVSITVPFNFLPPLQEEDTDGSGALSVNVDATQWQIRRTLIGGGGQSTAIFAPNAAIE